MIYFFFYFFNKMGVSIKKKNELGQILCHKCPKVLDDLNHESGKYTCKECVKKQIQKKKLENNQQDIFITHKTCNGLCGLELTINKFDKTDINNFRGECKACRLKKRKTTVLPLNVIQESVKGLSKPCKVCGINKLIIKNFSTNGNNYRHICKMCIKQKKLLSK